jgi:hypothetical protein
MDKGAMAPGDPGNAHVPHTPAHTSASCRARRLVSPATDKPVFDLVTRTSRFADALRKGKEMEKPPSYQPILVMFDRCCSLLGAIRVLLNYDFVHEAIILARPLFTDSLALAEIAAADEKGRDEFGVRLSMHGITEGENLFRSAKAIGDFDEQLRELADERKEIEAYARRRGGLSTKGWQPDDQPKELAEKHGREGEYVDMRLTNNFVHGTTKATAQRTRIRSSAAKTRAARWVTPPPDLFAAVTALCPRDDRVPDRPVFGGFGADRFRTALTRACTAAGIASFSPHDLRHRRVSLLQAQGLPWARIGEVVGHADLVTTARTYTHVLVSEEELDYEAQLAV